MSPSALLEYRFFVLNDRCEVQATHFAFCEDDAEAAKLAEIVGGASNEVEVWEVGRFVTKVRRDGVH